jgi:hypothetical protein
MHIQNIDILVAIVPVLVTTVFFTILIVARIYATSLPVNPALRIDPDSLGLNGLS